MTSVQEMAPEAPSREIKRYNLALSVDQYNELQLVANREGETVVDVLRRFIKLGLFVDKVNQSGHAKILIRENNVDREIMFV